MKKRAAGLLGVVMAAGALVQAAPASAGTTAPPPFCQLALGSTTSGGDLILRGLYGTVPPSASASTWGGKDLMPDNQLKVAGGLGLQVNADQTGVSRRQYVVLGSTLYLLTYDVKGYSGEVDPASVKRTPVGGGWGSARYIENSRYNGRQTRPQQRVRRHR
jgi:hypothetical protein